MSPKSEDFIEKMQEFFPATRTEYLESVECYGEVLETVVIEDIFMPQVLKTLCKDKNPALSQRIFAYFEEVANNTDMHLQEIFSVTVLEILGNDQETLDMARMYMGPKTTQLQIEADRALGRPVSNSRPPACLNKNKVKRWVKNHATSKTQ